VHTRQNEQEVVSCVDLKSGKIVWSKSYDASFSKNQYAIKMGKGPNSTPIVYAGNLYTLGVNAVLSCFDAKTGELKWRKDYSAQLDTSKLFCGTAMSPVIENGYVIVHVGDDRKGSLIAFDAMTGQKEWEWQGDGPGYSSPIVAEFDGVRQIVTLTDKSVVGLSAITGKLLWSMPFPDEWNENIVTPVLYRRTLIVSGTRKGTMAIEPLKGENGWSARQVWHNPQVAMYMSSPVLDGDYLYGMSSLRKGQYFCLDAKTGALVWSSDGREGRYASVLRAGDLLIFLNDDAELIIARKSTKRFQTIARYSVADAPTWAHPIIFDRNILVKDEASLTLWSIK
jgi:outer membrane protein assembly factor BamB